MKMKKVYLGSDHAGFETKERLKEYFEQKKIPYEDLGTHSSESVDYPDYALAVAQKVAKNKGTKGILVCGSGTGMVIAANKVRGIRAVAPYDSYSAKMSRRDNDANVLGLRARFFPFEKTKRIVAVWLATVFSGKERHLRRINKITKMESR